MLRVHSALFFVCAAVTFPACAPEASDPRVVFAALLDAWADDDATTRDDALALVLHDDAFASLPERAAVMGAGVRELLGESDPLVATSAPDVHHDVARVRISRDGARGLLMAQMDDDGLVTRLALFLDPLPEANDGEPRPSGLVAYEGAWATTDEAARDALVDEAMAVDSRYVDPTADVRGRRALSRHIGGFQQSMPSASIVGTSGVVVQHGVLHFTWHMDLVKDAIPFTDGMDVIFTEPDSRLSLVAGFFGPLLDDE